MFCGSDNILWDIPHIQMECRGIFYRIFSIPQNIVMDLNNVMKIQNNKLLSHPSW